jgi:hypothetical protein
MSHTGANAILIASAKATPRFPDALSQPDESACERPEHLTGA